MSVLNVKRIRNYPRKILFSTWLITRVNLLFHRGWIGTFGQVSSGDFVVYHKAGSIYSSDPYLIYKYVMQNQTQRNLVALGEFLGFNLLINPPYIAPLLSLLDGK